MVYTYRMNIQDFAGTLTFAGLAVLIWRGWGAAARHAKMSRLAWLGMVALTFKIFG